MGSAADAIVEGAVIGFLGGLTVAILGAVKDTTYEPFEMRKFIRSPVIGTVWGAVGNSVFKEPNKFLLYTFSISMERLTTETWKATTQQMPGKFKSPTLDKGWIYKRRE